MVCLTSYGNVFNKRINLSFLLYVGIYSFIPPLLIYFPFKKKWINIYPKVEPLFHKKKYATFKPEDVQESNGIYYCEVPLFDNIMFNYDEEEGLPYYTTMKTFKFQHSPV